MPFHVEVSTALRHARAFNLSPEELRQTVLEPWLSRRSIELGDRKWNPEESELKVLEGPELGNPDLNFGQGWANAQRSATDVTARVLGAVQESRGAGAGPTALVIETDSAVQTVAELASNHGARTVDLASLSERIDGRDPEVAAVIVIVQRPR
ncbi:MAG TPA: hypothetical protein VGK66_06715, partial [Solirubrobacterales bacterium]|nr:hypothetical protein [Solirubrobacterales bacterium]